MLHRKLINPLLSVYKYPNLTDVKKFRRSNKVACMTGRVTTGKDFFHLTLTRQQHIP